MPRQRSIKKLGQPPVMKGFKPYGLPICKNEKVTLTLEQYESVKLINYQKFSHEEAALQMSISRSSFTRLYNKALSQIAIAFVEGRAIHINGGDYEFDKLWFRCKKCHKLIEGEENHIPCENCSFYSSDELVSFS